MTQPLPILGQVRGRLCLLLVVSLVSLVGCSGDGDAKPKAKATGAPSSTTTTAVPEVKMTVAVAAVESMRAEPVAFPDDVRAQVVAALDAWVGAGVVTPLLTGQPPVGLDASFTPTAVPRLNPGTPDRAALLEEGPAVALTPEKASVSLIGLADQQGVVGLVTASIDVSLVTTTPEQQVRVARVGELVLIPIPGGWRIDSWDVMAKRDTVAPPQATTTTGAQK